MQTADQLLLERWRAEGDAAAFREITARYAGLVYAAAKRVLKDASNAEDVAQECFEALALRKDAAPVYLGAWLHTVATNRALNYLESAQRRRTREQRVAAATPEYTSTEWDDLYEHVDAAIAELPEELRAAIVGHFLEGRSKADLARALGVSRPAIHYRIDKGLEQVRHALGRRGVTASAGAFAAAMAAQMSEAAPASLVAGLGKLAITCLPAMGHSATPIVATTIAGSILMKKALIIGAVIMAVAGGGAMFLGNQPPAPAPPPVVAPLENEIDAVPEAPAESAPEPKVEASLAGAPDGGPSSIDAGLGDLVIAGRVVNRAGGPVEGALLEVGVQGPVLRVWTASDGTFRLAGLAPGSCSLIPSHKDYPNKQRPHRTSAGDTSILIELQEYAVVRGRVIDARNGSPVSEFTLLLRARETPGAGPVSIRERQDVEDSDGAFTLARLIPGDETIVVKAAGYATETEHVQVDNAAADGDLIIELKPGFTVDGSVVDGKGNPVEGAQLFSQTPPSPQHPMRLQDSGGAYDDGAKDLAAGTSGSDGRFSVHTFQGVEYMIYARHPEFGDGQALLAWDAGEARGVKIVLGGNTGSAEVRVSLAGVPAANATVTAYAAGGMLKPIRSGTTDAEGRVLLADLPEGPVDIRVEKNAPRRIVQGGSNPIVEAAGSDRAATATAEIAAGETTVVEIDFPVATSALEVSVHLDGVMPPEAGIALFYDYTGHREEFVKIARDPGAFVLEGIPAGEATLRVTAEFDGRGRKKLVPVTLAEGETLRVEIDMSGGGSVEGFAEGVAANANAIVHALPGEHAISVESVVEMGTLSGQSLGLAYVKPDGSYAIDGLEDGRYTLLLIVWTDNNEVYEVKRFATAAVDVADGETTTADFELSD